MKILSSLSALALVAAFAGTTIAAYAQEETVTLYQGAEMHARMQSTIDSGTARVGDRFIMDVVPPYPSGNPLFQGAVISGEVLSVTHAARGTKPALGLEFDFLRLADGSTVDISAQPTSVQEKSDATTGHGAKTALATLGGMLVGNALFKTLFGIGGGGIVGAAGGLLYGLNDKQNIQIPSGSDVKLTLNKTVTIRRQAPAGQ
jgi:hypothetical protein